MGGYILWMVVVLTAITSLGLILSRDWRASLALLALQYFGVFWLVQVNWPLAMSAAKLVTGWMAAAAIGMSQVNASEAAGAERAWPEGRLFRVLTAGMVLLAVTVATPRLGGWLPGSGLAEIAGGAILISMGWLHLGISLRPFRVILSLLTILSGFEILYAVVENSILVAALLSAINLGLALAGAYLMTMDEDSA